MTYSQGLPASAIRVGFVMHKMQVAGAEVLVEQIIAELGGTIEPTILCLDGIGEIGERLLQAGVPVIALHRKSGVDWALARHLAKEIKSRCIDVIHAHQYTPFFYTALARLRHGVRAKVLFTEHGRHYPDIVSWKRRWANRLILSRFADVTTACCDFSTNALRVNEGFPRAQTLRNGVDLDAVRMRLEEERTPLRARLGLEVDCPYAACVARFHPVKDHATLVRAWKYVHETIPEARLLLVGDGPERKNTERLTDELGLSGSIEFWGIRSDVAEILRAIDVFTLTSVSEAASLTLIEAMASGCAVVVTDVGGNGEHVSDGIEGRLVARGDAEQLGNRLAELLSDSELAGRLGSAARARTEQYFDLQDVIQDYAHLYEKLVRYHVNKQPSTQPACRSDRLDVCGESDR